MPSATTSMMELHNPSTKAYKKAKRQYQKATKNRASDIEADWTPFRAAEKRYKARFPPPNIEDVLDIATLDPARADEVKQGGWTGSVHTVEYRSVPSSATSKACAIPQVPGLVIIPGFLSHEEQRDLIRWSLIDHAKHPNDTNLDTHYLLPRRGLWNTYIESLKDPEHDEAIQPRAMVSADDTSPTQQEPTGPRQLINNTPAAPETFTTISLTPKPPPPPSQNALPSKASDLLPRLRWANIGWFYHWGVKQYDFSKGKVEVDGKLRDICKSAIESVDWDVLYKGTEDSWGEDGLAWKNWNDTYEPDAGIVNFYQTKDTLMAHVDRSEVCATSPLVSISLGNAAVFLIGGLTRDTEPTPILLRSGDVVIMSGPACRRAYHGVPRILEDTLPRHFTDDDTEEWAPFAKYMSTTRININVRQVFPKGFVPDNL
ncbi:hypothetical protein BDN71DRAFT_1439823, partial [Pleurotus eryngii]